MRCKYSLLFLVLFGSVSYVSCWDNEQLELFDLVEEVNKNFYDVLGVEQTATTKEIKKAYRKLTLQYHPDKNDAADAEEKFRQLVAIYDVLKDEARREEYNTILINGLPDWRQPVFYYRRVRKLGLLELTVLLFVILTVGHFIVIWTVYFEKQFEMQEVFKPKRKKKDKKGRKVKVEEDPDDLLQEQLSTIPKPQLRDYFPCLLVRSFIHVVTSMPSWCLQCKDHIINLTKKEEEPVEEDESEEERERREKRKKQRAEFQDFQAEMAELSNNPVIYNNAGPSPVDVVPKENIPVTKKKKEWDDEELGLLAKAVAKFPSGIPERWEKIADMVGRSVSEVTAKSKELKSGFAKHVDPAAQGTTGAITESVNFKKGKAFSDTIISQRSDWGDDNVTEDSQTEDTGTRRRNRPKKPNKSTERTLLIVNQNSTNTATTNGSSSKNSSDDKLDEGSKESSSQWTQNQQKVLEWGLAQYPKGTPERWEKIAEHITGKTKEDCINRFKYLAEVVKKRKAEATKDKAS